MSPDTPRSGTRIPNIECFVLKDATDLAFNHLGKNVVVTSRDEGWSLSGLLTDIEYVTTVVSDSTLSDPENTSVMGAVSVKAIIGPFKVNITPSVIIALSGPIDDPTFRDL